MADQAQMFLLDKSSSLFNEQNMNFRSFTLMSMNFNEMQLQRRLQVHKRRTTAKSCFHDTKNGNWW